jgi:hypothetical protein
VIDEATLLAAVIARPLDDQMRLGYADWLEETAGMVPCVGGCSGWTRLGYVPTTASTREAPKWVHCSTCRGTGSVSNGHAERAEFIRCQVELALWGDEKARPRAYGNWFVDCRANAQGTGDICRAPSPSTGCEYHALRRRERELLDLYRLKWIPTVIIDIEAQTFAPSHAFRRGFVESITCSWSDFRTHADAIRRATPLRDVTLTTWPELDGTDIDYWLALNYAGIKFNLPSGAQPLRSGGAGR